MWGRLKGQVLRSKEDTDHSDDDTIISRALIRFYAPEVPTWLAGPGTYAAMDPTMNQYNNITQEHEIHNQQSQYSPFKHKDSTPEHPRRTFERSDSFASTTTTPTSSQRSKASSGLANRLKNTKW